MTGYKLIVHFKNLDPVLIGKIEDKLKHKQIFGLMSKKSIAIFSPENIVAYFYNKGTTNKRVYVQDWGGFINTIKLCCKQYKTFVDTQGCIYFADQIKLTI